MMRWGNVKIERLPDFLIVGAMKSGTTSLYHDLRLHPGIFLPEDKEPENLCSDAVLSPAGREQYSALFRRAGPHQMVGEASTAYTKLPDFPGVAGRAKELLGTALRIVYLVRHPVDRAISQHKHEHAWGEVDVGFDEALERYPRYAAYSSYGSQMAAWLEHYPREQIHLVHFERYVARRAECTAEVFRFLGVPPLAAPIDAAGIYNADEGRTVVRGVWDRVYRSPLYRQGVRRLLSIETRHRLRSRLLPAPPPPPAPASEEARAVLRDRVQDDVQRFHRMFDLEEPLWDLAAPSGSKSSPRCFAEEPTPHD